MLLGVCLLVLSWWCWCVDVFVVWIDYGGWVVVWLEGDSCVEGELYLYPSCRAVGDCCGGMGGGGWRGGRV